MKTNLIIAAFVVGGIGLVVALFGYAAYVAVNIAAWWAQDPWRVVGGAGATLIGGAVLVLWVLALFEKSDEET